MGKARSVFLVCALLAVIGFQIGTYRARVRVTKSQEDIIKVQNETIQALELAVERIKESKGHIAELAADDCSLSTDPGQLCYDYKRKVLFLGNGSKASNVNDISDLSAHSGIKTDGFPNEPIPENAECMMVKWSEGLWGRKCNDCSHTVRLGETCWDGKHVYIGDGEKAIQRYEKQESSFPYEPIIENFQR